MWLLRFTDILQPELGGTITAVLDGTEAAGQKMMDNMCVDQLGQAFIQEDPGNQAYQARIHKYDILTDVLTPVATSDPARFVTGAPNFLTLDEETSGIIDMQDILGKGRYLLNMQAHYGLPSPLIEGGQILELRTGDTTNVCVPPTIASITSAQTICSADTLELAAAFNGTPSLSYSWSGTGTYLFGSGNANALVTGAASGVYTVTVSNACGSATGTVNVTVTPTTSNTTTISACDTYTWAVNGQTYTASGTYTSVTGCATEILALTITPSTSNTTTISACDTYTWAVNGTIYTASGTYTSVTGCATEILVLTITGTSSTNTTTISACDTYTWAVNGTTYTASGTYTNVSGCNTEILVLTITPSTSNTTTITACDTYTWAVNGTTYTASGTYTSVTGCATRSSLSNPSTSNTTTISACDTYTWSVNGTTYTASGTYTSVTGCATEILVLTITRKHQQHHHDQCLRYLYLGCERNDLHGQRYVHQRERLQHGDPRSHDHSEHQQHHHDTACDTYTWAVNGTTYTASGTYTSVTGCATEILVLTITPSTSNTTTTSACDTYTWSVNGTTYTASGTYTSVTGCATEILVLTITPSTSNTTTISACDTYTWAVNGTTYTASGTYTSVTGCATEILVLTITPSTSNTTTITACSSYTWSVNGQTYSASGTFTSVNGCATDILVLTINVPGTACNDNNANTINDVYGANCVCAGTPIAGCDNWTLEFTTDNAGSESTWQIINSSTLSVIGAGGPYASNTTTTATICIPAGACYRLTVTDANGMSNGTTGGFVLRDQNGKRVLDNAGDGVFTGISQAVAPFCSPVGNDGLIASQCDKVDWIPGGLLIASPNSAVSAQYGVGTQNNDGYEFRIFNPDGGYDRTVFITHANPVPGAPAGPNAACYLGFSSLNTNPVPQNVLLNVRVRSAVNGVFSAWGPACRFKIDAAAAACPLTKLITTPGSTFSCGATGKVVNASGAAGRIYAQPVTRPVGGVNQAANAYLFELTNTANGYTRLIGASSYTLVLGKWATAPLLCGTHTYNVRVRASFDGGATYCPYGAVCTVGITNNFAAPFCTAPSAPAMAAGDDRVFFDGDETSTTSVLNLWPNPNNGEQLYVTIDGLQNEVTTATVDIFDMVGHKVTTRTIAVNGTTLNTVIALDASMANGMYLVNVTAGDQTFVQRLVIQ